MIICSLAIGLRIQKSHNPFEAIGRCENNKRKTCDTDSHKAKNVFHARAAQEIHYKPRTYEDHHHARRRLEEKQKCRGSRNEDKGDKTLVEIFRTACTASGEPCRKVK